MRDWKGILSVAFGLWFRFNRRTKKEFIQDIKRREKRLHFLSYTFLTYLLFSQNFILLKDMTCCSFSSSLSLPQTLRVSKETDRDEWKGNRGSLQLPPVAFFLTRRRRSRRRRRNFTRKEKKEAWIEVRVSYSLQYDTLLRLPSPSGFFPLFFRTPLLPLSWPNFFPYVRLWLRKKERGSPKKSEARRKGSERRMKEEEGRRFYVQKILVNTSFPRRSCVSIQGKEADFFARKSCSRGKK